MLGIGVTAGLVLAPPTASADAPGGNVEPGAPPARTCEAADRRPDPDLGLVPDHRGGWEGSNPIQKLRVRVGPGGIQIEPEAGASEAWWWRLALVRGPDGARPEPEATTGATGGTDRIELRHPGLAEWLENHRKGFLQGIDLLSKSGSPHRLAFRIEGTLVPKIGGEGRVITFTDRGGRPVLAYRDLEARDAEGRSVPARWERPEDPLSPGVLVLAVETAELAFPVRIQFRLARAKAAGNGVGEELQLSPAPEAAPGNDDCAGAEIIPGSGPFPALSAVHDIAEATTGGDPPAPSCQTDLSRSIWFSFTPAASGLYTFSLCSDAPTQTTVEDTVLAIYAATGPCAGLTPVADGCDDDSCSAGDLQSVVSSLPLSAGTTYYAVVWKYGAAPPDPGSTSVQLRVIEEGPLPPPPANDLCSGAVVLPGGGPFPYTAPLIADISGATTAGDPPPPSCQPAVSRSVWYAFTPAASGSYTFSLCADAPTGTTVDDTVLALYSSTGACSGLAEVPGGCDDDSCAVEGTQSVITGATLSAGTPYYLVAWKYDSPPPASGNTALQLRVSQALAPGNDRCLSPVTVSLNVPVSGTTMGAADDTDLSDNACFGGLGQSPTPTPGGDVAYRFTAPADGDYSFRVRGYDTTRNVVLYVADDCPAGPPPGNVTGCRGAANRNLNLPAEEVACLFLSAGTTVYAYVDETSLTAGSPFTFEVDRCRREAEPNSTPATAMPPKCGLEGSIAPLGDADFHAVGSPEAGSRIFALVDGVASNNTGFDLRLTTAGDTVEYDDADNDLAFGTLSANLSGAPAPGGPVFLRVSHSSATQLVEPYRLYVSVQPPPASATAESEPNGSIGGADTSASRYFSGSLNNNNDEDHFAFTAEAGELIQIGLDLDPTRDNTPFNGALSLLDAGGALLMMVDDGGATSSTLSGAGSLTALTPRSPGEALAYRARTTGTYYARVSTNSGTHGDYLLSIARDCGIGPDVDLAVSQTDSPDPVPPGGAVTYTIHVDNLGASPAAGVVLRDDLPDTSTLVSVLTSQGTCDGSGPVFCYLGSIAAGGGAQVTVTLLAPSAIGVIDNRAEATGYARDPVPGNNVDLEGTMIAEPDSDGDGVVDTADCAPADPDAWAIPSEATGLAFPDLSDTGFLAWSAPALPGGTQIRFDLLRSTIPSGFPSAACAATDLTATSASDTTAPGTLLCYLVRAENGCGGNLGTGSGGAPRTGPTCP